MSGGKAGLSAGQPLRPTGNSIHKPYHSPDPPETLTQKEKKKVKTK